jgi:hypothetical protein
MRFSTISSGLVAIAAASALAACAGHGLVPSQGAAPDFVSPTTAMLPNPKATPPNCQTKTYQPEWIFKGSCVIGKLTKAGVKLNLPAYQGISMGISVPKNNSAGSVPFVFVNALDKGDTLSFKGKAFPQDKTDKGVLVYAEGVNLGKKPVTMDDSLLLIVALKAGMKYPGKLCSLSYLSKKLVWTATPVSAAPTKQQLKLSVSSFLINDIGGFPPYPVAIFFAIHCS